MNNEYKDCQYFFEGKCRCMDSSFNQDFYECPQCEDVSYCYYKQLKRCEAKLEKIKEYALSRMTGLACRHILNNFENFIEGAEDD